MSEQPITLNGYVLNSDQSSTFRLALDLATMNLQTMRAEKVLEGLAVSEHVRHLCDIKKLVSR